MAQKMIGIDIGSYNTKIVNIERKKNSVLLSSPTLIRTPRFLMQNGRIADKVELAKLIGSTMEKSAIKGNSAILILNDQIVITRDMELPPAKNRELEQMVRFNASEFLPFDSGEYIIRHKTLISADKNPAKTNYVLMTAVKNEVIADFMEVFQKMGVKLDAIDVSINGMIKYLHKVTMPIKGSDEPDKITVLVDMGASLTRMLIAKNGVPQFQQVLNYGSQRIDVLIANSLDLEREAAEQYKIKYGLDFESDQSGNKFSQKVGSIISAQINLMLKDIYEKIQAYMTKSDSKAEVQILLTGGMAKMKGLSSYIQQAFSRKCELVKTGDMIKFSMEDILAYGGSVSIAEHFPYFSNLVGAANRGE